ncbi:MAG TPA: ABC transporter permease [Bryobacteraceae bacterium]|nr:ABC transporter permease [Bryobacteraceae bacterium]
MSALFADLRYGLRLLRQAPGFTAVAICALALGIGANTAIFSTVDSVVLRALPFDDPDRLMMVWEDASFASFPKNTPAVANYVDWKNRNRVFTDMAAVRGSAVNLTADGPPEQVYGRRVTPNFFSVLGAQPILGRTFTEEEDRASAEVTLISYGLWQRRYSGDSAVIGKSMLMDGKKVTIIGVMPRDFVFRSTKNDYWKPASFTPQQLAERGSHYLNVVARLKPGVTLARAREDMNAVAQQLQREYKENYRLGAVVEPVKDDVLGNTRAALWVLMAAAGCVLLIACANLASLLLARAVARQRELAVRAALGAGRGRLIGQMVTEGMLLSIIGGALGLGVAPLGMRVLARMVPTGLPQSAVPAIDARLLGFTLVVSLITGLLFSIVPAIQAARASLNEFLKQGGRSGIGGRSAGARDILVVLEVAAALVLLIGAGLMIQTLARLRAVDVGFRSDHLLTVRTILPQVKYQETPKRLAFFDRVLEGVRALPGVESASYISMLPFEGIGNTQGFQVEGRPRDPDGPAQDALLRAGTMEYLKTLGAKMLEGRMYNDSDGPNAPPVIVINETFARRYWPKDSALGHRISLSFQHPTWRTIIGVVRDVQERGYAIEMKPGVYVNYFQYPDTWATPERLLVRTKGDPLTLVGAARAVIASVDPEQPVSAVTTMDEIIDLNVADRQQQMTLLGAFAGLALLLASIGLYGVLSYAVTQRSREIGLRMALGASASNVVRMVVSRGLALTATGLGIGLVIAWAATRLMKNLLYGVAATDPATYGGVAALLAIIALAACWLPARRASRVDPITVLREE